MCAQRNHDPAETPQALYLPDESQKMKDEIASAALKATPPVAYVGAERWFDLTMNELVTLAVLIYTVLQICVLIRNEFIRKKRK